MPATGETSEHAWQGFGVWTRDYGPAVETIYVCKFKSLIREWL